MRKLGLTKPALKKICLSSAAFVFAFALIAARAEPTDASWHASIDSPPYPFASAIQGGGVGGIFDKGGLSVKGAPPDISRFR